MARVARLDLGAWLLLLLPAAAAAQQGDASVTAVRGVLVTSADGSSWAPVGSGAAAPAGKTLIAIGEATLRSANGAVTARLVGELGDVGPLPALEAAVRLHPGPGADLELSLLRGIVVLTNEKKSGAARVTLRLQDEPLEVTLAEPGTQVGIDAYGRHSPGLGAVRADRPTHFLFCLCLRGRVELATKEKAVALSAPPGPALLRWDSIYRHPEVTHLAQLPEWVAQAKAAPDRPATEAAAARLSAAQPVQAALELLGSAEASHRKVGVTALGALDRPADVVAALSSSKADVRRQAILVLRQWLGRQPEQIRRLQDALTQAGFSAAQVESGVHLLLGFDDEELRNPATYQMLIDLLAHSKPAVRELAHWHLVRLAPRGRDIVFDAAAPSAGQAPAVEAWRRLIPAGRFPGGTP